jgi:integrase
MRDDHFSLTLPNATKNPAGCMPPAGVTPDEMARLLMEKAPTLADLTPEQLKAVAQVVMTQDLVDELRQKKNLAGIDWKEERAHFLDDTRSAATRRVYSAALDRLELWASRKQIDPLTLNASQADQFIRDLKAGHIAFAVKSIGKNGKPRGKKPLAEGLSPAPATTRRDISAISAFYSKLERYHDTIRNPFRGTRIRPPNENKKETVIPTEEDYKLIIRGVPLIEQAIIKTLALRGLRAGALPTLTRSAGRYYGVSKGKKLTEGTTEGVMLPQEALDAIEKAGLDSKKPFAGLTPDAIEQRVNYWTGKFFREGAIKAPYSAHDFRHFFAVREYEKDKDIFRVSKLLNHADVSITQRYLRSLKVSL